MTRYIQLPDGNVITLHVFDKNPPPLERGWIRSVVSSHWCVDEEVMKVIAEDKHEWVDERTSE